MDRHLRLVAIMIEVTSRHAKCTHFNLDYSRMPAVARHYDRQLASLNPHAFYNAVCLKKDVLFRVWCCAWNKKATFPTANVLNYN